MRRIILFMVVVCGGVDRLYGAETPVIRLSREEAPNLLKNSGFEQLDRRGMPTGWSFDNCAVSPQITAAVVPDGTRGNMAVVDSAGNLSAYWSQSAEVKGGNTYYAEVKFRTTGPRCLLWLKTPQWSDGKSPMHHPLSQTELYARAYPWHGEQMKKALSDFIDPRYLRGIDREQWNRYGIEFKVPAGHGITSYQVRGGAYFGEGGRAMLDDFYFGLAETRITAEIAGTGLRSYAVVDAQGKILHQGRLADAPVQRIRFTLPSRVEPYTLKIIGPGGQIFSRSLNNEEK